MYTKQEREADDLAIATYHAAFKGDDVGHVLAYLDTLDAANEGCTVAEWRARLAEQPI